MSFLSKLWDHIKTLFGALPQELKIAIHIGVIVVENIKAVIDSPVADILTAIIPGNIDDKVKEWLRAQLPTILKELKLADSCGSLTDPNEITACALKTLGSVAGDVKSGFFHNLSILIAQVAADGKLTWQDGVYILQWYYDHRDNPEVAVKLAT